MHVNFLRLTVLIIISSRTNSELLEHFVTEVLKASFAKISCVYIISDFNITTNAIEKNLLSSGLLAIHINGEDIDKTNEELSECGGYIIESNSMGFLEKLFNEHFRVVLKPHLRTLVFFGGKKEDAQHFLRISDQKGIDTIIVYNGFNVTPESEVDIGFVRRNLTISYRIHDDFSINKRDFRPMEWTPTFKNDNFFISAYNCVPFALYDREKDFYDGVEIRILKNAAKNWPLKFKYYVDDGSYNVFIALRRDIESGRSDTAICSQWQEFMMQNNFDMTTPYTQICVTLLVPKAHLLPFSTYVFQPLDATLWIVLISNIILVSVITRLLTMISYKRQPIRHPYLNYVTCILDIIKGFLGNSLDYFQISKQSLKILLASWCLQCIILTTTYSAGYTSVLAYPRLSKSINSIEDVLEAKIRWGATDDTISKLLQRATTSKIQKLAEMNVKIANFSYRNRELRSRKMAVLVQELSKGYITDTESLDDYGQNNLKKLPECIFKAYLVFPFKKRSPFEKILSKHIKLFIEHGFISHWYELVKIEANIQPMSNFLSEYSRGVQGTRPFSLEMMQGSIYLLIGGHCIAVLVFLCEIVVYERKNVK